MPECPTEWEQRGHTRDENWKKVRASYAHTTVAAQATPQSDIPCSKCKQRAPVVRCLTCLDCVGGYARLCGMCDEEEHPHAHFHVRQVWNEGYYEEIPAQQGFDGSGQPVSKGEVLSLAVYLCLQVVDLSCFAKM